MLIRMWIIGIPTKVPSICRAYCEYRRTGANDNIANMNRLLEAISLDPVLVYRKLNVAQCLRLHCGDVSMVQIGGEGLVMALSRIGICDFGWKAREFVLKGVDGKTYTLAAVVGRRGCSRHRPAANVGYGSYYEGRLA